MGKCLVVVRPPDLVASGWRSDRALELVHVGGGGIGHPGKLKLRNRDLGADECRERFALGDNKAVQPGEQRWRLSRKGGGINCIGYVLLHLVLDLALDVP